MALKSPTYKGRAHAVLVYLAFDSIKKQHVTFFTPQITFPHFTHVFFWPQIQTNINNKSQPRPSMPKSHSPKKAMLGPPNPNLAKFFLQL